MAGTTGDSNAEANAKRYREYLDNKKQQAQQAQINKDLMEALEQLKQNRSSNTASSSGPTPTTTTPTTTHESAYNNPEETRMRNFQTKAAPIQMYGGMAAMPIIAKDSFAPMFGGTQFAQNAREYMFNRRVDRYQNSARVGKDEATALAGRLSPREASGSSGAVEQLARDKYYSRTGPALNESEAVKFAKLSVSDNANAAGGYKSAQYQHLGIDPKVDHKFGFTMDNMIEKKAIADFHARDTGVRGSVGKVLYGNNSERQGVLKNLPIDLSTDTVAGRAANAAGHVIGNTATALPAFGVGLGAASQMQKLGNLRKERHITGTSGKVAETGMTAANLIRAGIFAPAATLMAAPAIGAGIKGGSAMLGRGISGVGDVTGNMFSAGMQGVGSVGNATVGHMSPLMPAAGGMDLAGNLIGGAGNQLISNTASGLGSGVELAGNMTGSLIQSAGHGLYRSAKDSAFGMTSMLGGGMLKGMSGAANAVGLGGGNVDLGTSLAGAAKGVGLGASMASMTPALVGGLGLALPGIIGGIAGNMSDKKRRIARGFKQPENQLVKRYSKSKGLDSVIRTLFNSKEIQSDRMLELQLLMYIEQNTSSIPKMVSDMGLMSDRKEKDSNETINTHFGNQEAIDDGGTRASRFGEKAKFAWSRGLVDMQELAHTINIPGQIMDLLVNRKTPWARKEEFRIAREDANAEFQDPRHARKVAKMLGTSASHVQLLTMSSTQLIRSSGAESADSQQVILMSGIFDLLRHEFKGKEEDRLIGTGMSLQANVSEEQDGTVKQLLQRIPLVSSLVSAYSVGEKLWKGGKKAIGYVNDAKEDYLDMAGGHAGGERTGIGRFFSSMFQGKNQLDLLDQSYDVKSALGFGDKTTQEKIDIFNLTLPDLWSELLHLNRITVDSLQNIFRVNNALLASSTGQSLDFVSSGSEQGMFDVHSGKFLSPESYNDMIENRQDSFADAMSDSKPGFFTKVMRGMFGGKGGVHAENQSVDKINQMMDADDSFYFKNNYNQAGIDMSAYDAPGQSKRSGGMLGNCCEPIVTALGAIYEVISSGFNVITGGRIQSSKLTSGGKAPKQIAHNVIPDEIHPAQFALPDLDMSMIPTSGGFTDISEQDSKASDGGGFFSKLFKPLRNQNGFLDTNMFRDISRSATDELDENDVREEKRKSDDSRKSTKDGFQEVIKLLQITADTTGGAGDGKKKKTGLAGLFDKLSGVGGLLMTAMKIAVPVLLGLKGLSWLNQFRSDGGSSEPGTGAYGKKTDTVTKVGRAALTYGATRGATKLGEIAAGTTLKGSGAAIKAGMVSAGTKGGAKVGAKVMGKVGIKVGSALGKSALKKIPLLGAVAGGIFAIGRAMKGDWAGAGLELASGLAAGFLPGPGWAISLGLDAMLLARDIAKASAEGGELSPELQARAEEMKKSARKNMSTRAFKQYGDQLDRLKELAEEGKLVFNKEDKKWYTKAEADKMGMTDQKKQGGGVGGWLKGLFTKKPPGLPDEGMKWKRVDHKFGVRWEQVPKDGSEATASGSDGGSRMQSIRETDADRKRNAKDKPKSLLRKIFDWSPVGLAVRGVQHQKEQWGGAFTAVKDAGAAFLKYKAKQAGEFLNEMKKRAKGNFDHYLKTSKKFISDTWETMKTNAKGNLENTKQNLIKGANWLYEKSGLKSIVDWNVEKITAAKDFVKGKFTEAKDAYLNTWVGSTTSKMFGWLKDKLSGGPEEEGKEKDTRSLWQKIKDGATAVKNKAVAAKDWVSDHTPAAMITQKAQEIEMKYNDGELAKDKRQRILEIRDERLANAKSGRDGWVQKPDGSYERRATEGIKSAEGVLYANNTPQRKDGETVLAYEKRMSTLGISTGIGSSDFGYGSETIDPKRIMRASKGKRKFTKDSPINQQFYARDQMLMRKNEHLTAGGIQPIGSNVIGLSQDIAQHLPMPNLEQEYFSQTPAAIPHKVTPGQMAASNSTGLRADEDLPSVQQQRRAESQVKIPTHSSAPSAINAGMAPSKGQSTQERPINPEIESFIENVFANTVNAFEQSVKSFAMGQTPFQILR